ncbi:hypothetical protein [Pseudonocardia sp. UM4_GMWB1]|uniref:hypothetical protein n=1 Tax=Pseudonocardia sp. UM4_GMWB1 TaxID=2212989 RepID=UPI00307E26A1
MPTTNRIDVDGRPHINRAEIADRTGISAKTQRNLYVERATNGHPEAHLQGREAFFDEHRVIEWYTAWAEHKQANRRLAQDDAGDADELLDVPAATRFLGYASQSTIRGYLARNDGYFPEADDCEDLPSGRVRRPLEAQHAARVRSTCGPPWGRGNRSVPALTPPRTPVVAHPFSPGKMRKSVLPTIHKRCKVGHVGRDGKTRPTPQPKHLEMGDTHALDQPCPRVGHVQLDRPVLRRRRVVVRHRERAGQHRDYSL